MKFDKTDVKYRIISGNWKDCVVNSFDAEQESPVKGGVTQPNDVGWSHGITHAKDAETGEFLFHCGVTHFEEISTPIDLKVPGEYYMHGDKETARDMFQDAMEDAGVTFTSEELRSASYTGYEVTLSGYWLNGEFWVTHIENTVLAKPTKI